MEVECVNDSPFVIPAGAMRCVSVQHAPRPWWKRLWARVTGTTLPYDTRWVFERIPSERE